MTVKELADRLGYETVCMPQPDREIRGGYAGDLLSWVMGRLGEGEAWVTIMTNVNIVAVAVLADPACIILSENTAPDEGVVERAQAEGVNILRSVKTTYGVCADICGAI